MVTIGFSGVDKFVATIIVAADGTGNFTNIQSAIDDLPSTGGVIYIKEGTYTITSEIDIDISNVRIVGSGMATIITTNTSLTQGLINAARNSSVNDVIIENMHLDCNGNAARGILFGDPVAHLTTPTRCVAKNCLVDNFDTSGIFVEREGENCSIIENVVRDGTAGFAIGCRADDSIVMGNSVLNNSADGIQLAFLNNTTVTGNVVIGNDTGIVCSANTNECIISSNTIDNNSVDGVNVNQNSDFNLFIGNNIRNNSRNGIQIADAASSENTIVGNIILNNTSSQIDDSGTDTFTSGNNIL